MAKPVVYYRPSITAEELNYLVELLENPALTLAPSWAVGKLVYNKLKLLAHKIALEAVSPAYTTTANDSLADRLDAVELTPVQKREAAYIKYTNSPELCTKDEITLARTYMYERNMLTNLEREEYEDEYLK